MNPNWGEYGYTPTFLEDKHGNELSNYMTMNAGKDVTMTENVPVICDPGDVHLELDPIENNAFLEEMFNFEAGESSLPPKKRPFLQLTEGGVGSYDAQGNVLQPINNENMNVHTNRKLTGDRYVRQYFVRNEVVRIKPGNFRELLDVSKGLQYGTHMNGMYENEDIFHPGWKTNMSSLLEDDGSVADFIGNVLPPKDRKAT